MPTISSLTAPPALPGSAAGSPPSNAVAPANNRIQPEVGLQDLIRRFGLDTTGLDFSGIPNVQVGDASNRQGFQRSIPAGPAIQPNRRTLTEQSPGVTGADNRTAGLPTSASSFGANQFKQAGNVGLRRPPLGGFRGFVPRVSGSARAASDATDGESAGLFKRNF